MKIFSWVHRKLNQKDGLFDRNVKKNEVIISNDENIGDDCMAAHLLGGCWKGGILAIGTFGFDDPLIKDQLSTGLDDDDDVDDHEKCEIIQVSDHVEQNANNGHDVISHDDVPILANVITGNVVVPVARRNDDEDESNKGSKKERITLADLFSADQLSDKEKVQLPDLYDVTNVNNKKPLKLSQVKNGVSFAKKIIPRVKEDSRRIIKLQKLITKALRKKVHPDMENKHHKNRGVIAAAADASTKLGLSPMPSESMSLLEFLETTA